MQTENRLQVIVVGGGLAGLAAATYLARDGQAVTLYEKADYTGGRATTHQEGEFYFNQGPHALYLGGPASQVLDELGVAYKGHKPVLNRALAIDQGRLFGLPLGARTMLTTKLLDLGGKGELIRFLARLSKINADELENISVADWLARDFRQASVRRVLPAFCRLTTYVNAPELLSAAIFVRQLQASVKYGVVYIDGGWQTLVDGLKEAARRSGVKIETGTKVEQVEYETGRVQGVRLADGQFRPAQNVVLANGHPAQAAGLFGQRVPEALADWVAHSWTVQAACLNLALRKLPQPQTTFALGIDQPLYYSVHSEWAKLGPAGNAVIHALRYLPVGPTSDARQDEQTLEAMLDCLQPGWQSEVIERRFLPKMTVCHVVQGQKVKVAVPGIAGLYVAGDWVNATGWLSDAALGSAQAAAHQIGLGIERPIALSA